MYSDYVTYYNAANASSWQKLGETLYHTINHKIKPQQQLIILCIGTDRVTGGSLGPLVGHRLLDDSNQITLYGNLESPVHAMNLRATLNNIYLQYKDPFIVAIDASLGTQEHIGYVTLMNGPIKPGQGLEKELPAIGDVSITGIVNLSGYPGATLLQNTRIYTVMQLVDCISNGIAHYFALF